MAINITNPTVDPYVFHFTEPVGLGPDPKHFQVDVNFTFSTVPSAHVEASLAGTTDNFANFDRHLTPGSEADVDIGITLAPNPTITPATVSFDVPFDYYNRIGGGEHEILKTTLTLTDKNDNGTDQIDIWVDILGRNDLPTAFNDAITVNDNTASFTNGGVLANDDDVDIHDVFSVIGVGAATAAVAAGGTVLPPEYVAQIPGTATFTGTSVKVDFNKYYQFLAPGESVTFNVPYTMSDGHGGTDTAFVVCRINGTATANFVGTNAGEQMLGENDVDKMSGKGGNDTIFARAGNDTLTGDQGNDVLVGGLGADDLFGGTGNDIFRFNDVLESPKKGSLRDMIFDFKHGQDKIDLSGIDAIAGGADNSFKWIGKKGFHHTAGELDFVKSGHKLVVYGDINGDAKADFSIGFVGLSKLIKADFDL